MVNVKRRHEDIWWSGVIVPPLVTSPLDEGEWSALLPGLFTSGNHWIGGSVGPRTGLDDMEENVLLLRVIEPWLSVS
jgi:hypothetical protein